MSGIKIYNAQGIVELDSTKRTPLFLGETEPISITSSSMSIPMPGFLSGDPVGVIAIARVINSNSGTNAVVRSIGPSVVDVFLQASIYRIINFQLVPMPVNGSFVVTFFRG